MIEHLTPCGGRCWALGSCHLLGPHSAREGSGSGHVQAYSQGYPPRQAMSPLVVSCALRRHFSPCCQHQLSHRRKSTESQQQPAKQVSQGLGKQWPLDPTPRDRSSCHPETWPRWPQQGGEERGHQPPRNKEMAVSWHSRSENTRAFRQASLVPILGKAASSGGTVVLRKTGDPLHTSHSAGLTQHSAPFFFQPQLPMMRLNLPPWERTPPSSPPAAAPSPSTALRPAFIFDLLCACLAA